MDCPKCGQGNKDTAKFCHDCGEAIVVTRFCPQCGKQNQPSAAFCAACGATIGSAPPLRVEEKPSGREQSEQPADRNRGLRRLGWAFLLVMALLVTGYLTYPQQLQNAWSRAGGWIGLPSGKVRVPAMEGMTLDSAKERIAKVDLLLGEVEESSDSNIPPGQVIESDPAAGREVERDTSVRLTVSVDKPVPPPVPTVQSVTGMDVNDAKRTLKGAGYGLAIGAKVFDDDTPRGTVVRQNPSAGSEQSPGTKVNVVLSLGSGVIVPNEVGNSSASAKENLSSSGLVARTRSSHSTVVARGMVIKTDPPAGRRVTEGSTVTMVVSAGPPPAPTFRCRACGASFASQALLAQHRSSSHPSPRYVCSQCGESLPSQSALNSHVQTEHRRPPTSRYHCRICGADFDTAVRRHMAGHVTKAGGGRFTCQADGQEFGSLQEIRNHMSQHVVVRN